MRSLSPGNGSKNAYLESTWKEIPRVKRHELLYDVAKMKKEKISEINDQIKKKKEEDELSQCTFQPRMFNTWDNIKEDSFYKGVPSGFKVSNFIINDHNYKIRKLLRECKEVNKKKRPKLKSLKGN